MRRIQAKGIGARNGNCKRSAGQTEWDTRKLVEECYAGEVKVTLMAAASPTPIALVRNQTGTVKEGVPASLDCWPDSENDYASLRRLRQRRVPTPRSPVPSSSIEAGSGTGLASNEARPVGGMGMFAVKLRRPSEV